MALFFRVFRARERRQRRWRRKSNAYPETIVWVLTPFMLSTQLSDCFVLRSPLKRENIGRFPFNKNPGLKSRKFYVPNGTVHPTQKPPHVRLLFLKTEYEWAVLGTTILSNAKRHFGPTDRDNQNGQSGPPSKLVPNIPVGPNRNGRFHLMYQPKF